MRITLLAATAACAVGAAPYYSAIMQAANASMAQLKGNTVLYPSNSACAGCYGSWATTGPVNSWTCGFFPGLLLKLYNYSSTVSPSPDASWWLDTGSSWSSAIAVNEDNTGTHDVGFMVLPTFVQQFKLTGNATARDIAIRTAHSLAVRYSPIVGCIRSWGGLADATFQVIIDNMMNLELLWWAAQETGNATLRDMAASHSNRMIEDIYQPSYGGGCVWHLVVYSTANGSIISRSSTPQGLGLDTVWARGQSWATHGFTIAYRYTNNASYLTTAFASAECFMRLTAATSVDSVPPWDFNATSAEYQKDTSAAAIATSAIVELAWYADAATRTRYLAWAYTSLTTLATTYANNPAVADAVLRNGTTTYPASGVGIIYGDYYLLEGLMKYDATPATWRAEAEAYAAAAAAAA